MDIRALRTYQHFYPDAPKSVLNGRSRVPVDIELMGIFSTRRFWQRHVIQEFNGPRQEAQRILRLIEQELQDTTT